MGQNLDIVGRQQQQSKDELLYQFAVNGNVEAIKSLYRDGAGLERHLCQWKRKGLLLGELIYRMGTDIPDELVLDQKLLLESLKKEDEQKREERDERKRKYNVRWNDEDFLCFLNEESPS